MRVEGTAYFERKKKVTYKDSAYEAHEADERDLGSLPA